MFTTPFEGLGKTFSKALSVIALIPATVYIVAAEVLEHPKEFVATTVYNPLVVAVIDWLVAPFIIVPFKYHWLPVKALDDKVIPAIVIVGTGGFAFTVIVFGTGVLAPKELVAISVTV
jgi:hypothetical protein